MLGVILLVLSVPIDSFLANIVYGTNKIKIPLTFVSIVDIISTSMLGFSLLVGGLLQSYISASVTRTISPLMLFLLRVYRLFESLLKSYIKSRSNNLSPLAFRLPDFNVVLQAYADETKADFGKPRILTSKETLYLISALSLDSLAVGSGNSLISINYVQVFTVALLTGIVTILPGAFIGKKFVETTNINLSWLPSAMLVILVFLGTF